MPRNRRELHDLLRRGDPGIVITTVHKFAEAGHLNDRSNIIVLVDEAHRSQEGKLGDEWRAVVLLRKVLRRRRAPRSRTRTARRSRSSGTHRIRTL